MEQRKKIILIIVVGVLIIAGIITWFVISEKKANSTSTETDTVATLSGKPVDEKKAIVAVAPTQKEKVEVSVKSVVTTFVERFGSFSNHANFFSVEDIVPMMTSSMASWVQNTYLPTLRREYDPQGFYYSVQTTAPVVRILKEEGNYMEIMVETQRVEDREGQKQNFNQAIKIDLVKSGEEWLVDGAFWQKQE